MKKISVIIPIYNSEKLLRKCIDSVCGQTYRDLEIICIDDGSTDGSGAILDNYAERDSRIIAIHQENAGESAARNTGLRIMTGDYFAFLDCDDWIEPDTYELLLHRALLENADLVAASWFRETDESSEAIINKYSVVDELFNREQLLMYIYQRDSYQGFAYMWDKLYRRNLFFDSNNEKIFFDEELILGGDVLFLARMALNTHSATYIDAPVYHYTQRKDSGCHSRDTKKRWDWVLAYIKVIKYIEDENIETNAMIWIKRFLAYQSSNLAEIAYEQNDVTMLRKCQDIMEKYYDEYVSTNDMFLDRIQRYKKILRL